MPRHRHHKRGNPGPLGLLGFGFTTLILNMANVGWFPVTSVVLATGVMYGGLAQIIAGILEYWNGNTFGLVAFTSYGAFWIAFVLMRIFPALVEGVEPAPSKAAASWLLVWGIVTLFLCVGTLKGPLALTGVFLSLAVLFFLLAAGDFTGNLTITHVAGWVGLVCGALALYLGLAETINETLQRKLFPVGQRFHFIALPLPVDSDKESEAH